jgi:hypothetical protein
MNFKTCTRAEWDANQAERRKWSHEHGFDPGMPWHVANWRERMGIALFYGVMWGAVFPAMLIGGLMLIGMVLDGWAVGSAAHDACLKHATNGYEIRACH